MHIVEKKPQKNGGLMMSIQMNSEEEVGQLLDRLQEQVGKALCSKLKEFENEVKQISDLIPKIKSGEKSDNVVQELYVLEQQLKNEMESSVLFKNLDRIRNIFLELKKSIIKADDPNHDLHHSIFQGSLLGIGSEILEEEGPARLAILFHREQNILVKMCLFCLSIFPENVAINKRVVIYWWIGEGIIPTSEAGEEVVQHLLDKCFIWPRSKNSFIMDPWIRRMMLMMAERNNFLTLSSPHRMPCNGQHRVLLWEEKESYDGEKEENVLSVFNMNVRYLGTTPEWLSKLQKVEVLHMGRWQHSVTHHIEAENTKVFDALASQKHLKYLSLRGISRIETLPDSIAKLVSLKILDLRACHNLEKLPVGISELKNLTHLDVSECYLLESMPKGLDRLSKLEVLKGFVIGKGRRNTCKISDLAGLERLWKLSIRVGETLKDDNLEMIREFSALRVLTIMWSSVPTSLSFPKSLTKLDLRCVPFGEMHEWLRPSKLPVLEKLYIRGGKLKSLEHNDEQQHWKVKCLRLNYLKELDMDEKKLETLFPEYQYWEKINCGFNMDSNLKLERRR